MIVSREAVIAKLKSYKWKYPNVDKNALEKLSERIAAAGKERRMIKYSELVSSIAFRLPNVKNGEPYFIKTWDWSGFDRGLIGEFLGYISVNSYIKWGFMASAIVVLANDYEPSPIFFDWMSDLELISYIDEDTKLAFWADQVKKAFKYYSENS